MTTIHTIDLIDGVTHEAAHRTTVEAAARRPSSPGRRYLAALAARDFDALDRLLAPDVWLRALLPRHLDEHYGASETIGALRGWYGGATAFQVLALDHDVAGHKERVRYRFRLRPDWAPDTPHLIEQQAYLSVADGMVRKIDLVCTGFMPVDDGAPPA
ncbi:MAG TPA: nuclear transport factor 2 family protein [Acidimicrobiales bacterium]